MKIIIDIPDEFINDYITDRFKDFFSRVAADIDNDGLCGNYERETAEMFLKAFEESGRKTKADEIRNMSDEELAKLLFDKSKADEIRNMSDEELAKFLFSKSISNDCFVSQDVRGDCDCDCTSLNSCYKKHLQWIQSEAE